MTKEVKRFDLVYDFHSKPHYIGTLETDKPIDEEQAMELLGYDYDSLADYLNRDYDIRFFSMDNVLLIPSVMA